MPIYEFKMLCMNNKDSCDFVKNSMYDFHNIQDVNEVDFDHKGLRTFSNDESALKRLDEIKKIAGPHLLQSKIFKVRS